ncbi:MAG: T9SS type A sorting domain-containing protein [Bacteroidota bacterium]
MKKLFTAITLLSGLLIQAQQNNCSTYIKQKTATLSIPETGINNAIAANKMATPMADVAKQILLNTIPELQLDNVDIKLQHTYQSLVGTHYQFIQTYLNKEVYQSNIKIALNSQGQIINILNSLSDLRNIKTNNIQSLTNSELWMFDGSKLINANKKTVGNTEQIIDQNNNILYQQIKSLNKGPVDTNVTVKLFNPDPLSTARSPYVAPYLNYNKIDTPSLNNERKNVSLSLQYSDSGQFIAANKYVLIKDIFAPFVDPFKLNNISNLAVTRNTDIFKQEMAMYHISQYQNIIQNVGITNLQNQLWVDALGDLSENSRFEFTDTNPYMILAIGGIPDSEDADVITHEYTHAIGYYISPNSSDGEERIGIDEGNADIMAVLYSLKLSDYNWRKVFNWDGNETWNGRNTLNTKNYKTDFTLQRYALGDIWSGAVTDIAESIGVDNTIKLLITSMASYQNNMTIPQFAQIVLQNDSILFNKAHYTTLTNSFIQRSILNPTSVDNIQGQLPIQFINTYGFANNNERLQINLPLMQAFNIDVINLEGKSIYQLNNQHQTAVLNASDFKSGLYFVKVSVGDKLFVQKIIKN